MDAASVRQKLMERACAAVAERCARAARKYGGHPVAALSQALVSDRVDTAVDRVESARPYAPLDLVRRQPNSHQLRMRSRPVLARGELRNGVIEMSARLSVHNTDKCALARTRPLVASFGGESGRRERENGAPKPWRPASRPRSPRPPSAFGRRARP